MNTKQNFFKRQIINTTMNHKQLMKQKSIEGYLEILDSAEVELRRVEAANGYQPLGVIKEKQITARPLTYPLNRRLSLSVTPSPSDADDAVIAVKRDSFIRQSYNTIRKSLRFKNAHRGKIANDDNGFQRGSQMTVKDGNNNRNAHLKDIKQASSFSDECVTKKKPMKKHVRNRSLGSYFSFRWVSEHMFFPLIFIARWWWWWWW